MPNYTPNYNLTKPLGTDLYDIAVQNSNMDKIDEVLSHLQSDMAIGRQTLPSGTDLNTVITSGCYRLNSNNRNAPGGSDYGQLLVIHGGGDTIAQILVCYADGSFWTRSGNPVDVSGTGDWQDWKKLSTVNDAPSRLLYNSYTIDTTKGGTELEDLLDDIIGEMENTSMRHISVHDRVGHSSLTGGTSFITVNKYNDDNVVLSAYKYGKNALRLRVKTTGEWSNWFSVYSPENKPTPEDIGAVKKSGDTMTGGLTATGLAVLAGYQYPSTTLKTTIDDRTISYGASMVKNTMYGQVTYNDGKGNVEYYMFPDRTNEETGNAWHNILTSKKPVTIAQGGTGGTTPAAAVENLWAEIAKKIEATYTVTKK